MDKKMLREKYLKLRNKLSPDEIIFLSEMARNNLFLSPLWQKASSIMSYISFGKEFSTTGIIEHAWEEHKKVIAPICIPESKTLRLADYRRGDAPVFSSFGVPEPLSSPPAEANKIELCLVPGLVFDLRGNRIGFGAGYYDRFLATLSPEIPKIGLAFDFQINAEPLPAEKHDQKLHYILTEKKLYSVLPE